MKSKKQTTRHPEAPAADRLELDTEVVADLEASTEETEAIRGGANYSRAVSGGF